METSEKIIKVATHLFAEKGFHSTSIRDIAQKSKINSSMISYYFKSKTGLLRRYYEVIQKRSLNLLKLLK
jgi:AcrR family transcriptional regulator